MLVVLAPNDLRNCLLKHPYTEREIIMSILFYRFLLIYKCIQMPGEIYSHSCIQHKLQANESSEKMSTHLLFWDNRKAVHFTGVGTEG
jgi:hypothetical protein